MAEKAVAYLRVSTRKQGESGLGIDAQRAAVAALARERGWELLGEHVEVESGTRDDRPELATALLRCRTVRARLALARAGRRVISLVISLAFGRHFRVLACVAASPLLGRLLGFLSFTLSLGKGVLVLSRHALQGRLNSMTQGPGLPEAGYAINNSVPACSSRRNGWVRVSRQCGPLPLPAPTDRSNG